MLGYESTPRVTSENVLCQHSDSEVREAGTPHPRKKNQNLFGNYGFFMSSRMAQEIIFGLFPFSRKMILKCGGGGVLASREASANFFPEVLREI